MSTDTTAELDIGEPDKEISVKKTFGIDSEESFIFMSVLLDRCVLLLLPWRY